MSKTAILKLIGSSKATVLVACVALLGVMVFTGHLNGEVFMSDLKWLLGTWFASHAGEQGAKAIAQRK